MSTGFFVSCAGCYALPDGELLVVNLDEGLESAASVGMCSGCWPVLRRLHQAFPQWLGQEAQLVFVQYMPGLH